MPTGVTRKYRIPLLTKSAIVKLKIDLFSVSMIFLSALRWKLFVSCFVESSLHSPPELRECVKQIS